MSKTAKREYIREKSRDYARTLSRGEKHAIVQEVARTCEFSVKYVIRRLNAPLTAGASAGERRGRPPLYTQEEVAWLKRIWRESDFLCGKLLACAIPSILESLAREGVAVPERTRERLEQISPATIDRLLRPLKTERPRRPRSGVLADLRKEIPVRALRSSGCPEPGHLGVDTVALVRGLFGELRLDEFSCREALERACALASLRHNHFIPSRKALRKTRDPLTGTTRTRYAKAAAS